MGTPLWQFWTDWAIKALGILATLLAVYVALFGPQLRHWIVPPRLSIALASGEGWPAVLHVLNNATNQATQTMGIWYHVRVENETRWSPVTDVHIFLLMMEAPDTAGDFQVIWEGSCAVSWRHEPSPEPKSIGRRAEGDLCHVLKEPRMMRLSPLVTGQVPEVFTGPLRLRLTLQARGIESDSNTLRVTVSWNGQWSDDREEMRRHFVVAPA